jgi:anti-anti-sigma factor
MSDARAAPSTSRPNRVEVEFFSRTTAIVALVGEHDLATRVALKNAFELAIRRRRHLVVDLSTCTFLDSTVISTLTWAQFIVTSHKGRLALVLPDDTTHTARVVGAMHLEEVIPASTSPAEAVILVEHATRVRDLRIRVDEAEAYGAECDCGWNGEPRTGEFAERRARADGSRHTEEAPNAVSVPVDGGGRLRG